MSNTNTDIRNKKYTIKEASEILNISTSSVNELKRRMFIKLPNSKKKYILKHHDISNIFLIVWKIKSLYGVVTLSTINKFFSINNGKIHKPTQEELEDLFRYENIKRRD